MTLAALCDSHYYEENCQKNRPGATTEPVESSVLVSMEEGETLSFKGHWDVQNSVPSHSATAEYAPNFTGTSGRKAASREKRSNPAIAHRTSAVPPSHTDTEETDNPIGTLILKHEPTVYTGRGLLPCSSFIFLAEAPIPRVGRQLRVDHRAIFATNNQHAQMARYGVYNQDFGEADASFARPKPVASVPDWAEFSAGTKNSRGERKKKYIAAPRKSGGRVRGWVK